MAHPILLDATGALVYAGGVDNAPLGKNEGTRVPYLQNALTEVAAGKPISLAETQPCGCSVK